VFYIRNAYITILIINTPNYSIYNISVSAILIRRNFISRLLLVVHIFNSIYFYILNFFNIAYKLSRLLLTTNCRNRMEIGVRRLPFAPPSVVARAPPVVYPLKTRHHDASHHNQRFHHNQSATVDDLYNQSAVGQTTSSTTSLP